jgi:hypothetical protein
MRPDLCGDDEFPVYRDFQRDLESDLRAAGILEVTRLDQFHIDEQGLLGDTAETADDLAVRVG